MCSGGLGGEGEGDTHSHTKKENKNNKKNPKFLCNMEQTGADTAKDNN